MTSGVSEALILRLTIQQVASTATSLQLQVQLTVQYPVTVEPNRQVGADVLLPIHSASDDKLSAVGQLQAYLTSGD
jgi:hypothetical protein